MTRNTKPLNPTTSMGIRLTPEQKTLLQRYSELTGCKPARSAVDLMWEKLESELWQLEAVHESLEYSKRPDAKWITHEKFNAWVESLGTPNELEPPRC